MMYEVNHALIHDNIMKWQNDGVALYHCDNIDIWDNDFSWNTSFGIRMYFTDTCHIHYNNCSHVNRPFTNPSDCAALLVIVSKETWLSTTTFRTPATGYSWGSLSTPTSQTIMFSGTMSVPIRLITPLKPPLPMGMFFTEINAITVIMVSGWVIPIIPLSTAMKSSGINTRE